MPTTNSSSAFRVGLVQLCSGRDVARNVRDTVALVHEAAAQGADYIQTPEVTTLMELERPRLLAAIQPEAGNVALGTFTDLARDLQRWLHIGSMAVAVDDGRFANRSYVIDPNGRVAARYDKIHMFDVDLGNGDVYRESESYAPGAQAVIADLPWGLLGLTICYDLRFPALHRALAKNGAQFLAAPAAFTRTTGEAHWHTLLRARAVEAQSFVFAAAQAGRHENGRETFGHSLIISPWGDILAEAGVEPGVVVADIDMSILDDVRRRIPSLTHDRVFDVVRATRDV
ncbi:MAG TPA: carbon-nitrogen hydrolase family protein [Hyphomicrobium sp.]|nr:carbon-nitrogen hydrolase family protein [Hyphomicrobium sp.]